MIGLVLAMVWARRGQALTLALLTLFGVAAAVAGPAYLLAADRAVATQTVAAATGAETSYTLIALQHDARPNRSNPDVLAADVSLPESGPNLTELPGFRYAYSTEFPTLGMEPTDKVRTRLVYRQDACAHLTMLSGRCLIGESDAVIGEQTAKRLRLAAGDEVTLRWSYFNSSPLIRAFIPNAVPKRFLISGVYRATQPGAAYWGTHNYFGPDTGNRPGEPVFVTNASMATMDHGAMEQSLDGAAVPGALTADRLPAVEAALARLQGELAAIGPPVRLETGIPDLMAEIAAERTAAHRIVPVLAVGLVLLACLTIYLAVGYGTEGRRPELAVVALRGARWGQRWWLATGENVVAILAGTAVGCMAGQLLVAAFAAWRFPGLGAGPGWAALRWAPLAAAAALITALAAERRQLGRPVTELLRRMPPARRNVTAIAAEAVVVLLAGVAVGQLAITGGGLTGVGTFAASLVLIAAALIAARLLLPWATVIARRQLRAGRLGAALAAFQLSRRAGGVRLFALLTAAVAVIGYAACAVDVGARGREVRAGLGIGADQVVSVGPVTLPGLLAAVRTADPEQKFAMAAVRLPAAKGEPPVLAVDVSRFGTVAVGGTDLNAVLHPAGGPPVTLTGSRLTFDLSASGMVAGKPLGFTAVLGPSGEAVDLGELPPGRHTYPVEVPDCARTCTLKALRLTPRPGALDVAGTVTVHGISADQPLDGQLADGTRWRSGAGGRVTAGPDGLAIEVSSLNGVPAGLVVQPADTPSPLPVAVAGPVTSSAVTGFDGRAVPVVVKARLTAVPGLGAPGVLADLDYADRLDAIGAPAPNAQVWLNAAAPPDVLDRLAAQGLVVTGDLRSGQVRDDLARQGPALALWFYVIVAGLAAALAAGALVLAAAVDRARRIEDLSALRGQGLARPAVRQATLWTYPVLVGAAVLAGTAIGLLGWSLTGWALPLAGLDPPPFPLPSLPSPLALLGTAAATFLVLAGVAVLAGRRTLRAIR